MWYYIKQPIVPFLYLLFGTVIAIGILVLKDNLIWLKLVVMVLNIGLYLFIVGAASFKDGETALKVRMANDSER
jgi:multisubunit Na+/H+ antiporter MnhC subunit